MNVNIYQQSRSKTKGINTPLLVLNCILATALVASCAPASSAPSLENMITPLPPTPVPTLTSGRPNYAPGELADYTAQSGDTLPALAKRFNTTEDEIRAANPIIPMDATTMPPGMPMKIPIYYLCPYGALPFRVSQTMLSSMAHLRSASAHRLLSPPQMDG